MGRRAGAASAALGDGSRMRHGGRRAAWLIGHGVLWQALGAKNSMDAVRVCVCVMCVVCVVCGSAWCVFWIPKQCGEGGCPCLPASGPNRISQKMNGEFFL